MWKKKINRKEFLKLGFFGFLAIFIKPMSGFFERPGKTSLRVASHYKNLAG